MKRLLFAAACAAAIGAASDVWAQKGGKRRPDSAPKLGDAAPDFSLCRVSDKEQKEPVKLSAFKGKKPVVLIFGSYT